MREIRFSLLSPHGPVINAWAGWPAATAAAPFCVLRAIVSGNVDPQTGYLVNIQAIDRCLRDHAVPAMYKRIRRTKVAAGERLLLDAHRAVADKFPATVTLCGLRLHLTPFLQFSLDTGDVKMISVTQAFEFSAAHRLFCADLTAVRNQEVFGKCSNPHGHGHNYQLEVTLTGEPDAHSGVLIEIPRFEQTVNERVITRFDHKHLNLDCPEFAELNPSVENITAVIWKLLDGAFAPARLSRVRVWETPKTYAEITGREARKAVQSQDRRASSR